MKETRIKWHGSGVFRKFESHFKEEKTKSSVTFLGQKKPLVPPLFPQSNSNKSYLVRRVVEVVFDELVELDLAEVGLEGGGGPELLQVHQDEVDVEAGFPIWKKKHFIFFAWFPESLPHRLFVALASFRF